MKDEGGRMKDEVFRRLRRNRRRALVHAEAFSLQPSALILP
jgi:hypothetical protein